MSLPHSQGSPVQLGMNSYSPRVARGAMSHRLLMGPWSLCAYACIR